MRARRLLTWLAVGLSWTAALQAEESTTVLIVRHAEKATSGGTDPSLSAAGKARALALAHVAGAAGVSAVFHSELQRTRLTVAPLASSLSLTPIPHPAGDTAALVSDIVANWTGRTVLVCGHSNTVPDIVKRLTRVEMPDIPDGQYDNLYVAVLPAGGGRPTLTHLKYGARTP